MAMVSSFFPVTKSRADITLGCTSWKVSLRLYGPDSAAFSFHGRLKLHTS